MYANLLGMIAMQAHACEGVRVDGRSRRDGLQATAPRRSPGALTTDANANTKLKFATCSWLILPHRRRLEISLLPPVDAFMRSAAAAKQPLLTS
jgi:hypothetical protein